MMKMQMTKVNHSSNATEEIMTTTRTRLAGNGQGGIAGLGTTTVGVGGGKTPGPGSPDPSRKPPAIIATRVVIGQQGLFHFRLASSRRTFKQCWGS
jgi:hypothetical protein